MGNGRDKVTIRENNEKLVQDLIRVKQGSYFLQKFYERADETDAEVSRGVSQVNVDSGFCPDPPQQILSSPMPSW
jgi:hypothetical protein